MPGNGGGAGPGPSLPAGVDERVPTAPALVSPWTRPPTPVPHGVCSRSIISVGLRKE